MREGGVQAFAVRRNNPDGVFKPGMSADAYFGLAPAEASR